MKYYKINEQGYAVMTDAELPFNQRNFESIWVEEDEVIPEGYILAPDNTKPLWLPQWTGVEWVEGLSQEEIDEINNQPQEPTTDEMIMLAIAELDMQREVDKTEVELAIAELAETILGGI